MPNFEIESNLNQKGFKKIVGIDEVGRGALAGPLVVAGVMIRDNVPQNILDLVDDSKKLTDKKRRHIANLVKNYIIYEIYEINSAIIDEINILQANIVAVESIMQIMLTKYEADFAIIDGNLKLNSNLQYESVVKGDAKSYTIAIASIIAKIYRDDFMKNLNNKYLEKGLNYGFDTNVGYGTKNHFLAIEKFSLVDEHRRSFTLVKNYN